MFSDRMSDFFQRWVGVFGSAFILMFFSEYFFLNEGPVETIIDQLQQNPLLIMTGILEFGVYYAIFAYILHLLLSIFRIQTLNSLFLIGVLVGWAIEAIIVPVVYESIPISFVFPSIGWHALVDVLLGWFVVRLVMRQNKWWASLLMFIGLGAVWGSWATWFWAEPDGMQLISPSEFTGFAFVTTGVWLLGMLMLDYTRYSPFTPSKWEVGIVLGISALLFVAMAFAFMPFSLLLIVFIGITLMALRRMVRTQTPRESILIPLEETYPTWWNYPLTLLTPTVATIVYPMFYNSGIGIPTEDIVFSLLCAGSMWLLIAWVRPFVQRVTPINSLET